MEKLAESLAAAWDGLFDPTAAAELLDRPGPRGGLSDAAWALGMLAVASEGLEAGEASTMIDAEVADSGTP